jgi:hypothetical protein
MNPENRDFITVNHPDLTIEIWEWKKCSFKRRRFLERNESLLLNTFSFITNTFSTLIILYDNERSFSFIDKIINLKEMYLQYKCLFNNLLCQLLYEHLAIKVKKDRQEMFILKKKLYSKRLWKEHLLRKEK